MHEKTPPISISTIRHGLRWTALAGLITHGGRLVLLLALARLWPREAFGQAALIFTVVNFLLFFVDLGMSNALLSRPVPAPRVLSTLFWTGIATGLVLAGAVAALSGLVADFFNEPVLREGLLLAAPQLVLAAVGLPQRVLWRREMRFGDLAKADVAAFIVQAGVTLVLARRGVTAMLWGALAGQFVTAWLTLAWSDPAWRPGRAFAFAELRPYWRFGAYQLGDRALSYLAQRCDTVLIGRLLGATLLGPYDVIRQMLARPEALINPMVTQVAMPLMARHGHDQRFVGAVYGRMVGHLSAIQFPIYAFLWLAAEPVLVVLLGPAWRDQAAVWRWMAVFYALHTTFNPVGALLLALGAARRAFWWNVGLLLGLGAATLLGLRGGAAGVAAGLAALYALLQGPFYYWFIRPLTGLGASAYFSVFVRPVAATAVAVALSTVMLEYWSENFIGVIFHAVFFFAVYVTASWWINPGLRQAILRLVKDKSR